MTLFKIVRTMPEPINDETLGSKEKFWIEHNGQPHLVKYGRENTGENWAEKVASELCTLLDMPHAHYEFTICGDKIGVLTRNFAEQPRYRLVHGNELISSLKVTIDGSKHLDQEVHTVHRALAALRRTTTNPTGSIHFFVGYLMLDAWIGNIDRHSQNWAVVRDLTTGFVEIAPTFDHASCLGRELSDPKRIQLLDGNDPRINLETYTAKSRSGLYFRRKDTKTLHTIDAFLLAASLQRNSKDYWLNQLSSIQVADMESVLARIPHELISPEAKRFAMAMLNLNREKILGVKDA